MLQGPPAELPSQLGFSPWNGGEFSELVTPTKLDLRPPMITLNDNPLPTMIFQKGTLKKIHLFQCLEEGRKQGRKEGKEGCLITIRSFV